MAKGASCLPASIQAKFSEINQKFGPVRIVSAHRRGARVRGTGRPSYHASCRAADFHPPRGKYKEVLAYLRQTHGGGLGTYSCGMNHIHIDNGPRVRFHKCEGGGHYAARSMKGKSRKYAAKSNGRKSGRYASSRSSKRYASSSRASRRYASSDRASRRYASSGKSRRYSSAQAKPRYAARYSRRNYY